MRARHHKLLETLKPSGRSMRIRYVALALGVLAAGACKDANQPDLNNPSVSDFTHITDLSQVQALATGIARGDRGEIGTEIIYGETLGRDAYRISGAEPRTITELLGAAISNSDFLGRALWPYGTIRLANIGIDGVDSAASTVLTDTQKNATLGYMKTFKALLFMRTIAAHDTTGAPINVDISPTGPLAPIQCKADVLNYIAALLDSAATELSQGGDAFPFTLPSGFAGFDTPATFLQFNRGLAAKNDLYLAYRNYAANGSIDAAALDSASAELAASFMSTNPSDLDVGPQHVFSTNTGDATNGLFDPSTIRANPRFVNEAMAGDQRVAQDVDSTSTLSLGSDSTTRVSSHWIPTLYSSPTSPITILSDKELVLIDALVKWGQGDLAGAIADANVTHTNLGGLTPFTIGTSDQVLNDILYEVRYSLFMQSADRWIFSRMFGKLTGAEPPAGVGKERGYDPIPNFPIPFAESDARGGNVTPTCSGT